jgi:hypothetical protein
MLSDNDKIYYIALHTIKDHKGIGYIPPSAERYRSINHIDRLSDKAHILSAISDNLRKQNIRLDTNYISGLLSKMADEGLILFATGVSSERTDFQYANIPAGQLRMTGAGEPLISEAGKARMQKLEINPEIKALFPASSIRK